jgi:hypothetical protein
MFRQLWAALYVEYVDSLFYMFFLFSLDAINQISGAVLAVHHPSPHGILMMAVNDWECSGNFGLHFMWNMLALFFICFSYSLLMRQTKSLAQYWQSIIEVHVGPR